MVESRAKKRKPPPWYDGVRSTRSVTMRDHLFLAGSDWLGDRIEPMAVSSTMVLLPSHVVSSIQVTSGSRVAAL